jgi:hypothetical protein
MRLAQHERYSDEVGKLKDALILEIIPDIPA